MVIFTRIVRICMILTILNPLPARRHDLHEGITPDPAVALARRLTERLIPRLREIRPVCRADRCRPGELLGQERDTVIGQERPGRADRYCRTGIVAPAQQQGRT